MANRFLAVLGMGIILSFFLMSPAFCVETAEQDKSFDTIEALIRLLHEKGVVNDAEAERFLQRHKRGAREGTEGRRVITILADDQEQEILEKVAKDVTEKVNEDLSKVEDDLDYMSDELLRRSRLSERRVEELEKKVTEDVQSKLQKSSWAQRIRWGGDIRLRYQGDRFDEENADEVGKPAEPDEVMNTRVDRDRFRLRARLKAKATIVDDREENVGKVDIAARLSTGNTGDPISTNDTLGDYYNKDDIVLDQAYLTYTYKPELPLWGKIPQLVFVAGRMPNPWFKTDLVWDSDLNFEGGALKLKSDTLMSNPLSWFLTMGAFPLQEEEFSSADKWLYAGQLGFEYKKPMGFNAKWGLAYYNYKNITGVPNDPTRPNEQDFTAPDFQTKGNTLMNIDPLGFKAALAADYDLLNLTGRIDYDYWFPIHIVLTADFVKNIGFDRSEVSSRTGVDVSEKTFGYQVGLMVGYPVITSYKEWNAFAAYKYLEADAVLDAFTDSDFHLGGTNAQGWVLGGSYGVYKNVWLTARWMSSDEIDGLPLSIDTIQVDLNATY